MRSALVRDPNTLWGRGTAFPARGRRAVPSVTVRWTSDSPARRSSALRERDTSWCLRHLSLAEMGHATAFGDALTLSMTERILARRPLPGDRPAGPIPSGPKAVAKRASETTPNVSEEASAADPSVMVVSQATATFLDRHPMWCDGKGVELNAPAHRAVGQANVENIPARDRRGRAAQRVKEREARSLELWKRVNPGFMGQPMERSEYQVSLEYDESKLDMAKNCSKSNWKHHLKKTDTAVYVEAVARERIFAKAAAVEAAMPVAAQRPIRQERRPRRRRFRAVRPRRTRPRARARVTRRLVKPSPTFRIRFERPVGATRSIAARRDPSPRPRSSAYPLARPLSPCAASSGASAAAPSSSRLGPGSNPVYVRRPRRYSAPELTTAIVPPAARVAAAASARSRVVSRLCSSTRLRAPRRPPSLPRPRARTRRRRPVATRFERRLRGKKTPAPRRRPRGRRRRYRRYRRAVARARGDVQS